MRSHRRVPLFGPGLLPLLSAIAEGLVVNAPDRTGIIATRLFDGAPVFHGELVRLARLGLIDLPLGGPPSVTEDGVRVLADWDRYWPPEPPA